MRAPIIACLRRQVCPHVVLTADTGDKIAGIFTPPRIPANLDSLRRKTARTAQAAGITSLGNTPT
ncbi:hypothetical protein LOC67_25825 [Stieleria sp. JC731]|uniref:hypothetical protein n=1 Tax=Pirellulaceae TaxID=2691357 RepID=UPI001E2F959B|nr:hypothetical protein [Stieleria sp. JC731]MCC9603986.1 hypothetical protein [Stieleria sp. JC731]